MGEAEYAYTVVWFERAEKLGGTLKSYLSFHIAGEIVPYGFLVFGWR